MEKQIGEVSHFFGNIGVAIIDLSEELEIGDKIRFLGGETDFEQEVKSMEIDHEKVDRASRGSSVGIKTKEKVREGYKVYKV